MKNPYIVVASERRLNRSIQNNSICCTYYIAAWAFKFTYWIYEEDGNDEVTEKVFSTFNANKQF